MIGSNTLVNPAQKSAGKLLHVLTMVVELIENASCYQIGIGESYLHSIEYNQHDKSNHKSSFRS